MVMTQTLCPLCKVSWDAIADMLKEPMGSDNHLVAWRLINSCDICGSHFLKEIEVVRDAQRMANRLKRERADGR